mmetsp:Transcript_54513/g.144034  ORF Transcript_54513/g.144034 Transcript_54513/m.144034 type:complete len:87 (+) Transcript_54513:214-474(+)
MLFFGLDRAQRLMEGDSERLARAEWTLHHLRGYMVTMRHIPSSITTYSYQYYNIYSQRVLIFSGIHGGDTRRRLTSFPVSTSHWIL